MKLVEANDGSQREHEGKLFIYCDCGYTEPCPNGRKMGSDRCVIRIESRRLRKKERQRLQRPQR